MTLSPELALSLRRKGHDAVHAGEMGLHRASDTEILSRAKQEQRTVVTADLDYPRLLALSQEVEPSVILFRDGNWSEVEVVRRMDEVLAALTEAELAASIITLERERVRRRRLPLSR